MRQDDAENLADQARIATLKAQRARNYSIISNAMRAVREAAAREKRAQLRISAIDAEIEGCQARIAQRQREATEHGR